MGPCMCVAVGTTVVSIEGMSTSYYYDPDDDDLFDEEVEQPPQVPVGRP